MKKLIFYFLLLIISFSLIMCKHVDTVAQIAAEAQLLDQHTANAISLSARAFDAATERITTDQEYFIGRAVAANILSSYEIYDKNPRLTNYLNLICHAIVINSPRPTIFNGYHVVILDTDEVNAFATSGGHIFLTRGIIDAADSEDALAAVIAHEVAHIQLQHSIKSIRTNRITKALLVTAQAGAEVITGSNAEMDIDELADILNESVGEILQTMVNNGYSKEQEYEADLAAMYLMEYAGYNPAKFIVMLEALNRGPVRTSKFNRTHPLPVQRIHFANRTLNRFEIAEITDIGRQERFNNIVGQSSITSSR